MSTPFVGETRTFAFTFAPQGWLPCDGQLLPICDYDALFTLIGTTYGGDGESSFALPKANGPASGDITLTRFISVFGSYPER